jgi:VWFA-related protein
MSSRDYRAVPLVFLFIALFSINVQITKCQAPTSPNQVPAIKSEVRIVLVDVVVTQRKGEIVGGLHKEDFKVAEDGTPQTISFCEEHTGGRVSPIALPPEPPDVYTNYPRIKTTDSINILLLDSLNTQASDQTYVRPQMAKYLQAALAAPTGARVAIFTLGQKLRMVRGFTADSSESLKALIDPNSGTEAKFESQMASPARKHSDELACSEIRSPIAKEGCEEFLAEEGSERSSDRVVMTLQAFQALARYLAQFPGRKNVMWVASSFPISFFPESNPRGVLRKQYRSEIRQTADLLTADQVAVYPISAAGLSPDSINAPDNYGVPVHDDYSNRNFNQITMETLARDTGGRPFYNTNDLSNAMTEAINSGSHYYTLTYTPSNTKKGGKYRRIELKATNGSYKLAYRRGYYAENPNMEQAIERSAPSDPLLPLVGFGMPDFAQILYKVRVATLQDSGKADPKRTGVRYGVDFAIAPPDVKLETSAAGTRDGNIEVALMAYDYDGKLLNGVTRKIPIHLQPDVLAALQKVGFQLHEEIDLPSGDIYLQTGIYDLGASHAGTLGIPLHVNAVLAETK